MSPRMTLRAITLDCPDPFALAAFYEQATGVEPHPKSDAEFAGLTDENGLSSASSGSTTRLRAGPTRRFLSSSTSTSRSRTWTEPRPGCSKWAPASRTISRAVPGGGSSRTRPATRSAWPGADR